MLKQTLRNFILAAALIPVVMPFSNLRAQSPSQQPVGQGQKPSVEQKKEPQKQEPQKEEKPGDFAISVEVPVVTVDVVATTQHGDIITGLKKENFRVLEDGAPQTITNFAPTDAPLTMVILMEFSSRGLYEYFAYTAKYWVTALFPAFKPKDWVALVTFDIKPRVEVDFTQNKEEVIDAVRHLYFPGFSESNVFDALLDTVDRVKDVKGKKSILLIATGVDTFSKRTLDQTIKELRQTDVTIFAVGLAHGYVNYLDSHGAIGSIGRLNYYQAENQLKTFAQMTGGHAWFPQFDGELPGIFQDVAAYLRNQYSLAYTPTNKAHDGKLRKIKVELVAPDGSPLTVLDQKGKKQKYVVYAREGYIVPKGNVGD